jgi:osmotically-inducible protein OsmY
MMKSDSQLQLDVMNELKWEPGLHHEEIGVAVTDGVVTLSGNVKSYAEKLLAETTARRVKGVRAIAEDMNVRYDWQPKTSDSEIAQRVCHVLEWDPMIPKDKIQVVVEDAVVKLRGKVDWHYQKDLAFKDASKISGVLHIDNGIEVTPKVSVGDVKQRIEEAFERQADLEAEKIKVMADGSRVTLSGNVSSWTKRNVAERAAWAAPGVSYIDDKLMVV